MKQSKRNIVISSVLYLSATAVSGHAAVIDQVKSKVYAIKNETAVIKTKTTDVQNRLTELAHTANSQISEIDQLKSTLDSLKTMKDQLASGGLDPAEIFEVIDMDEVREKLDELKANKAELQNLINDPDAETFRAEFIEVLQAVNRLVSSDVNSPVSPLQTMISSAPTQVVSLFKAAVGSQFERFRNSVLSADQSRAELESLGLLDLVSPPALSDEASTNKTPLIPGVNLPEVTKARVGKICQAASMVGFTSVYWYLSSHAEWLQNAYYSVEIQKVRWEKLSLKADVLPKWGVHGYLTLKLPKTSDRLSLDIEAIKTKIAKAYARTETWKERVEWMRDDSGFCDLVTPS